MDELHMHDTDSKMNIAIQNYKQFDSFLDQFLAKTVLYHAFYSVRARYALHGHKATSFGLFGVRVLIKKLVVTMFREVYLFGRIESAMIFGGGKLNAFVAERTGFPVIELRYKRAFNIFKNLFLPVMVVKLIRSIRRSDLQRSYMYELIFDMIEFLQVYRRVNLKGIRSIIIENEIYPVPYAILLTAKETGVKTIKFDHYFIDEIYNNSLNADIYFYPNEYHKSLVQKFDHNRPIKFMKGGYPHWDILYDYRPKKKIDSLQVITFFTQPVSQFPGLKLIFNYLEDIIDRLQEVNNFELRIKVHPRDEADYSKYESNKVKLIYGTGHDIYQLILESSFTFSVFSVVTLEAKHLCKHSYFINYNHDDHQLPIDYKVFNGYLDVIHSKEQLIEVLNGSFSTTSIENFIRGFNPTFPNTCTVLKEVAEA